MSRFTLRALSLATRSYCSSVVSPTFSLAELEMASGCPHSRHAIARAPTSRPTITIVPTTASIAASSSSAKSFDEVPSPAGAWPVVGTLPQLIKAGGASNMHKFCDARHQSLGPIYKENVGGQEFVFLADADLIQKVYLSEGKYPKHMVPEPWTLYNKKHGIERGLFFMDGPQWSDRRKSLNKVFLKKQTVSQYSDVFNQVISDLLQRWTHLTSAETSSSDISHQDDLGKLTSLERELYNWSIESLGTMIFGRRLGCVPTEHGDSETTMRSAHKMHEFVECVQQIFVESSNMTAIPPKVAKFLGLPVWNRFEHAAGKALDLARSYVKDNVHLIKSNATSGCPLHGATGILEHMTDKENIDQDEVVRIITDLFIAAADTTSHATQWALYLLSRHPEAQRKIFQELSVALGSDSNLQEHHLAQLPYVKGVIKEALRLYPVAPFLTRELSEDIVLGGYKVPAGKMIVMSLYTTGRSNEYFSEPNQFLPERWMRKKDSKRQEVLNSYANIPFGVGVRSCIGRRVAEMQMQFLLTRVVQKFEISPGNEKEVGIKLRMITTPEEPIHLRLKPRNSRACDLDTVSSSS